MGYMNMAAKCSWCNQTMSGSKTCTGNEFVEFPDGTKLPSIPNDEGHKCPDCAVANGGFHHPGCDKETCPKCHGQLIGCGCLDQQEDYEEEPYI